MQGLAKSISRSWKRKAAKWNSQAGCGGAPTQPAGLGSPGGAEGREEGDRHAGPERQRRTEGGCPLTLVPREGLSTGWTSPWLHMGRV